MRRAVITGMGVVSSLGSDLNLLWDRLKAGKSGIRRITKFDASAYDSQIAGEVIEFDPDKFVAKKEQRRMDEFSLFAVAAAKMAMADSGLDVSAGNPERMGRLWGPASGVSRRWRSSTRSSGTRGHHAAPRL